MGLDIYFYKTKNAAKCAEYLHVKQELDDLDEEIYAQHTTAIDNAAQTWQKWWEIASDQYEDVEINGTTEWRLNPEWATAHPEPVWNELDFASDAEKLRHAQLADKLETLKAAADISPEIEDLYMRKCNWMVSYVYERHPECLEYSETHCRNVLRNSKCILNKADIEELVYRMKIITKCDITFTGEKVHNNRYTSEYITFMNKIAKLNSSVARNILPNTSGFFFGSTDYDWYYMQSIQRYLNEFKVVLDNWQDGEALLYEESW